MAFRVRYLKVVLALYPSKSEASDKVGHNNLLVSTPVLAFSLLPPIFRVSGANSL